MSKRPSPNIIVVPPRRRETGVSDFCRDLTTWKRIQAAHHYFEKYFYTLLMHIDEKDVDRLEKWDTYWFYVDRETRYYISNNLHHPLYNEPIHLLINK